MISSPTSRRNAIFTEMFHYAFGRAPEIRPPAKTNQPVSKSVPLLTVQVGSGSGAVWSRSFSASRCARSSFLSANRALFVSLTFSCSSFVRNAHRGHYPFTSVAPSLSRNTLAIVKTLNSQYSHRRKILPARMRRRIGERAAVPALINALTAEFTQVSGTQRVL
jgi:hypothetical protein